MKSNISKFHNFVFFENGHRNHECASSKFLGIFGMGSSYSRKREMICWQYRNIKSLKPRNQQTLKPIKQFETKKPRNFENKKPLKPRNQEPAQHTHSHPCTRPPSVGRPMRNFWASSIRRRWLASRPAQCSCGMGLVTTYCPTIKSGIS